MKILQSILFLSVLTTHVFLGNFNQSQSLLLIGIDQVILDENLSSFEDSDLEVEVIQKHNQLKKECQYPKSKFKDFKIPSSTNKSHLIRAPPCFNS